MGLYLRLAATPRFSMDPLWILLTGMAVVVGGILALRLHAFLALILASLVVGALTTPRHLERFAAHASLPDREARQLARQTVGERVSAGFGSACSKIGILIAMASIVGACLLESGGADRIVRSGLRWLGEARAPLAFLGSGFVLGIPVFFDTVFYLMIPLGKALGFRTGRNYGLYVLSIIAGATMAHSLVPPTPGPLFVASQLKVDLGLMILGGTLVGLVTVGTGFGFAVWVNRRFPVPLRETSHLSLRQLEAAAERPDHELPPLGLSLLPIALPVALIAGGTVLNVALGRLDSAEPPVWLGLLSRAWAVVGDPNVALAMAAAVALGMAAWKLRSRGQSMENLVAKAVADAGVILLITSAGGAFGSALQQSGLGWRIEELADHWQIGVLPLAFLVTALVRAAQGSATVAMITSVGIVGPAAVSDQLGFHPLYVALAIGCGSKPFPWMNDSGFWVICNMSGLTVPEMIRSFSCMLTLMGLVGLMVVMVLAKVFPMA